MKQVASMEVALVVEDIDGLLPFYIDVLGLELVSDITVPAAKSVPTGLSPHGYRIVRLETNLGDRIKLASPLTAPAREPTREYALSQANAAYVTFLIDNLTDVQARLARSTAQLRSNGIVEVRPGVRLLLVTDPAGNFLEFVQYDDLEAHRPRRATATT
jgi:catechol 2,3-dioxygenase-like lactoylglutathione lyase family enzyme